MLVYQDLLTGDELLSDSFPYKEILNGILWEVEGKWVVQGAVDVNIGANPSAEGGEEDEGVDDQAVKVVDIVDTFRLQEQPPFDKKQFVGYIKKYIKQLTPKLDAEQQEFFKKNIEAATKYLLSKLSDLQFFVGESMHDDSSIVFAYYKEGATDPTFLYFGVGLKEYTEEEVGRSYEEFYEDVHTEFLKFGEIINFKVCRNGSFHLRGNVYIQYKSLDSAVMAYNSVHGRYFASKQVKCEFVSLTRWKVAICGEYMKSRLKTCSRGSACNFLHCFTNPGGDYEWADCDKPPPRFWVTKMVALFGYSEDDTWHQPTPRDQHRIFTSDRVSYREKRHRSIEKNQHNGNSSRKHHDENHVRKSRKHERDKNYEHENSDSDGDRLRRHHEGSQTHSRHSRSKESNYRKSKRRTHGSSSSSSSCDEDFYTKKRHLNTKSRSRRAKNVSESSNDEESDDAELKRRKERKTNCQRSRRRGRDGGSCEIDGESGKVERRRNGRSRSREGGGGCLSEKIEMGDRWEPEGSPDELKNSEGDGKSSHGENRRSLDCDDKMRDKRKRI